MNEKPANFTVATDRRQFLRRHYANRTAWKDARSQFQSTLEGMLLWLDANFPDRAELGLSKRDMSNLDYDAYLRFHRFTETQSNLSILKIAGLEPRTCNGAVSTKPKTLPKSCPTSAEVYEAFHRQRPDRHELARQRAWMRRNLA